MRGQSRVTGTERMLALQCGVGEGVNSYTEKLFAGISSLMEESCRISGRQAKCRTSALLAAAGAGRGRGSHAEWQIWATVPAPAGPRRAGDLPLLPSPPAGCKGVGLGRAFVPHFAPGFGCCCLPSFCSTRPSAASILSWHPSFHNTHLSAAPTLPQHPSFCCTHPSPAHQLAVSLQRPRLVFLSSFQPEQKQGSQKRKPQALAAPGAVSASLSAVRRAARHCNPIAVPGWQKVGQAHWTPCALPPRSHSLSQP